LYTKGTEGNPSHALKDMLRYIEKTTIDNVTNQSIEAINNLVNKVKGSKEVGINYMKSWEYEKMITDRATKAGLEHGIEQGIENFISLCKDVNLSKEDTRAKLLQKFSLSDEKIEAYIAKYW